MIKITDENAKRLGYGTAEKMRAYYAKRRKTVKTWDDYHKRFGHVPDIDNETLRRGMEASLKSGVDKLARLKA